MLLKREGLYGKNHIKGGKVGDRTANDIWDYICTKVFFIRLPVYAIYEEGDPRAETDIYMKGKDVDAGRLKEKRMVGRNLLNISKLALNGIPLSINTRDEAISIYDMLKSFINKYESIIMLSNSTSLDMESVEAVRFLADSIVGNHRGHMIGKQRKKDEAIMNMLTPGSKYRKVR